MKKPDTKKELSKNLSNKFTDKYKSLPAESGVADKSNNVRFLFKKLRFWFKEYHLNIKNIRNLFVCYIIKFYQ